MKKEFGIVAAIVAVVLCVGLGIMFSGHKENIKTYKVEAVTADSVINIPIDTISILE